MKTFFQIAANALLVNVTNFFVWFALVFWVYLETKSVLASSLIAGTYMVAATLSNFWFGAIVDHYRKKVAMLIGSFGTLAFYVVAMLLFVFTPQEAFTSTGNPALWLFVAALLLAVVCSNIRIIAFPITVTILVAEDRRDRANGMSGMIMGLSSSGAGIASGFAVAYLGMFGIVLIGIAVTILAILHLLFLRVDEPEIIHTKEEGKGKVDLKGTAKIVRAIPGLLGLIFFTTFNNFLGGVFMALMDPYGLSLMSVQMWGVLWGFLSLGFIVGGSYISWKGLGKSPLHTLFIVNIIMWLNTILFPIQPSIVLLTVGLLVWTVLMPFVEATEHTIIQKVVPLERQGRVFGFAQSIETCAAPITAFLVGPLAQFVFIPFMTSGNGVTWIGGWFGTGAGRGMALVFMVTAVIGLIVTILATKSRAYRLLTKAYQTS